MQLVLAPLNAASVIQAAPPVSSSRVGLVKVANHVPAPIAASVAATAPTAAPAQRQLLCDSFSSQTMLPSPTAIASRPVEQTGGTGLFTAAVGNQVLRLIVRYNRGLAPYDRNTQLSTCSRNFQLHFTVTFVLFKFIK